MPAQCPECGRFLKNALVASLDEAAAPCPSCGTELTASRFAASTGDDVEPADEAPVESVRPPDLPPETVGAAPDPLEGWDRGGLEWPAAETAGGIRAVLGSVDRPTLLGFGAGAGALLGAVAAPGIGGRCARHTRRRALASVVGAATGVTAAAIVTRRRGDLSFPD